MLRQVMKYGETRPTIIYKTFPCTEAGASTIDSDTVQVVRKYAGEVQGLCIHCTLVEECRFTHLWSCHAGMDVLSG